MANSSPLAWFILRRTLHYPQLFAGEMRPLPALAFSGRVCFEEFLTARAVRGAFARCGVGDGEAVQAASPHTSLTSLAENADFASHPRAWVRWVVGRATDGAPSGAARRILRRTGEAARPGVVRRIHLRTAFAPQLAKRRRPPHVGPSASARDRSRGGRGAERFLTRRRSHEAAHCRVYFLPAFLSAENVMPTDLVTLNQSNLPGRAAGGRE